MNCIERKFKLDIQFAYIHRNSAQPWWKVEPTKKHLKSGKRHQAKAQIKIQEEYQTGIRDRLKKWINPLNIGMNGLLNI